MGISYYGRTYAEARRSDTRMASVRSTASSSTTFFAELRRIGRYFVVGGVAACMDIGLFMLFAQHYAFPYLRVAAATFVFATLVNYVLSVRFVFMSGVRFRRRWEIALVFGGERHRARAESGDPRARR